MKRFLFLNIFFFVTLSFGFEPQLEYWTGNAEKFNGVYWKNIKVLKYEIDKLPLSGLIYLRFKLPDDVENYCIYYYSTEQFYEVYVDELNEKSRIFKFYYDKLIPKRPGLTTGEAFSIIPLKKEFGGRYIYFKIFFANKFFFLKFKKLLIIPIQEAFKLVLKNGIFSFVLSIVGLFFGIIFLFLSSIGKFNQKALFGMGFFLFFISLRQFAESQIPLFFLPLPVVWGYIAYFSGFLIIFGLFLFLDQIFKRKFHAVFNILFFIHTVVTLGFACIEIFGVLPLSLLLNYYHLYLILLVVLIFILMVSAAIQDIVEAKILIISGGLIFWFTAIYELLSRVLNLFEWDKNVLSLGILFFIFSLIGILTYYFIRILVQKEDYYREIQLKNDEYLAIKERLENVLLEKNSELNKAINRIRLNNYLMNKELELAKKIQMYLVPKYPPVEEIAFFYKPMEQVCGDFYDFITFSDDRIGIFISDVSGHGVPAALITSMIKSAISQMKDEMKNPAKFLTKLNDFLYYQTESHFVTAFYCVYNRKTKKLIYANAGHILPFKISENKVEKLSSRNRSIPLGILNSNDLSRNFKAYTNEEINLKKNDKIFLFTDGLSEALRVSNTGYSVDENYQSFGETFLLEAIIQNKNFSCRDFITNIYEKFVEFRGANIFDDDVCMICLDVL